MSAVSCCYSKFLVLCEFVISYMFYQQWKGKIIKVSLILMWFCFLKLLYRLTTDGNAMLFRFGWQIMWWLHIIYTLFFFLSDNILYSNLRLYQFPRLHAALLIAASWLPRLLWMRNVVIWPKDFDAYKSLIWPLN